MGIAYRCDPETGLSVEVWHGAISLDVAALHVEQLANDPEWAASRRIVTDLTTMSSESRPSADDVKHLGDAFLHQLAYLVSDAKWSVIADSTFAEALVFGEHVRHEVRRMIVFTNLVTACVWLGVDPEVVQPVINELRLQLRSDLA
jgi:hypothetical protein